MRSHTVPPFDTPPMWHPRRADAEARSLEINGVVEPGAFFGRPGWVSTTTPGVHGLVNYESDKEA